MKFITFFLSCSILSFSQGDYVRSFNSNFFSVFGSGQSKNSISNGKDLVTWNSNAMPGTTAKIALMDSSMQVVWCNEYPLLNFLNSSFQIENINFDENNNILVCGNGLNMAYYGYEMPSTIMLRIDRSNGNVLWNKVVDSVTAVTIYAANKNIYFFGNKNRENSIVTYMSRFDSIGNLSSWICLNFSDTINGQYHITDVINFNKTQHLVYASPLLENKNNNRCKLLCLNDYMNVTWQRTYKELSHVPVNNRSLIAVNDSEFVVNNFERDSTLFKFNKKGQQLWGKKFNIGGAANPQIIMGNDLLLSMTKNGGAELIIDPATCTCINFNSNLLCEPLTGNYSNRITYYNKTDLYQLCSAANYFAVFNGCAGNFSQLPYNNFNAVATHHKYVYNNCAFQSEVLPSSTNFTLTSADSTCSYPNGSFATFFCNQIFNNPIPINNVYVEEGCGLSLGLNNKLSSEEQFKVFPNPAKNIIHFEISTLCTLQIINSNGQLCGSFEISKTDNEIDISFITKGVYILKFITNNSVSTKMLVKE